MTDAAGTVLGIFGFDRTLYGKHKEKKWWIEIMRNRMLSLIADYKEWNCIKIYLTNYNTTETKYLAFHNVKRKFFSLMEIGSENPEDIEIYEFSGQTM